MTSITRIVIVGCGWVGRQIAARMAVSGLEVALTDRDEPTIQAALEWLESCDTSPTDPLSLHAAAALDPSLPGGASSPPASQPSSTPTRIAPPPAADWSPPADWSQDSGSKVTESGVIESGANESEATGSPATGSSDPLKSSLPNGASPPAWLSRVKPLPPLSEITRQRLAEWRPELILECVPEQLSLKKRVLRRLAELAPDTCIVASNSSYFIPSVLSQFVSRPQRYAQIHFHVPVLRESVADIVGCSETAPEVLERLTGLARAIGQHPLVLRREHPGYVFNWLLQAVLKAALELVALDVVDAADVDRAWKSVTGMPVGPFGMMDQIGLDVIEQVLSNARWANAPELGDQQLLDLLRPLIAQGKLGVKTGGGFYDYESDNR